MQDIVVTRDTTATPAEVWAVMTDIEGSPERLSGIDAVERLAGPEGFGVGLRWRETRTMFGKQATEELEVTAVDEGRSYTVEAENKGTHYRSVMSVTPSGTGSTITMTFGAETAGGFQKLLAKTVGRAFEGATRKMCQQDLDEIAAAAEASASGA